LGVYVDMAEYWRFLIECARWWKAPPRFYLALRPDWMKRSSTSKRFVRPTPGRFGRVRRAHGSALDGTQAAGDDDEVSGPSKEVHAPEL
jgi:hypothetical protein